MAENENLYNGGKKCMNRGVKLYHRIRKIAVFMQMITRKVENGQKHEIDKLRKYMTLENITIEELERRANEGMLEKYRGSIRSTAKANKIIKATQVLSESVISLPEEKSPALIIKEELWKKLNIRDFDQRAEVLQEVVKLSISQRMTSDVAAVIIAAVKEANKMYKDVKQKRQNSFIAFEEIKSIEHANAYLKAKEDTSEIIEVDTDDEFKARFTETIDIYKD